MAKRKAKSNSLSVLLDFVDVVDTTFEQLTGKSIASWFKEFQQRSGELPAGEQTDVTGSMPLADAYAILGLPPTASLKEIKKNYGCLAAVFHPDKGGYTEAMVLLNNAYERVMEERGEK